jgi:dTDP-4-dehydrorhamnose reductase
MEELIRTMETRQPQAGGQRQMEETPPEAVQAQGL